MNHGTTNNLSLYFIVAINFLPYARVCNYHCLVRLINCLTGQQ